MIEIAVSMTVMSIVMTIFSSGVLQVYSAMNKTESLYSAQAEIMRAFQRLDRELRYASQVNDPSTSAGDFYVEYLMTNTGTPTCVQLRLLAAARQLQRRQWLQGDPPANDWTLLISSVGPAAPAGPGPVPVTVVPFVVIPPDNTFLYQKLEVNLKVTVGTGRTASQRETKVRFTALNTPTVPDPTVVCVEGRVP